MDFIRDIVQPLQERLSGGVLGTFYDRRRMLKGRKVKRAVLLSEIKNDDAPRRGYAYHRGGRSELQFNIGFEEEGAFFRVGVAYSIETGPYVDDPVGLLSPSIARFNRLIGTFDTHDLSMWRYVDGIDPGHNFNRMSAEEREKARKRAQTFADELVKARTNILQPKSAVVSGLRGLWGNRVPDREQDVEHDSPAQQVRDTPARKVAAPAVTSSYAG